MKAAFKTSLALNAGLFAALWLLWPGARAPRLSTTASSPADGGLKEAGNVWEASATIPEVREKPFCWREIESTDYRIYIANLRRIGCPEPTIRDIIAADLESNYASRRKSLERTAAAAPGLGQPALERGLQDLRREQALVLAALLGQSAQVAEPLSELAGTDPNAARPRRHPAPQTIVSPLFFQTIDPAEVHLDPVQIEAINDLRQRFIDAVGGPDQDPNDPAYAGKWLNSQPEFDNLMRGMIGVRAYQNYELAARANLEAAKTSAP